jgi:cobalamin biosynthesis protein CobT
MVNMSIFKIFEFATSVSFILAIVTVIISFAIFFILKRIRDNENKTNTLIGIVADLTNELRNFSHSSKQFSMGSGIALNPLASDLNVNYYDEDKLEAIPNYDLEEVEHDEDEEEEEEEDADSEDDEDDENDEDDEDDHEDEDDDEHDEDDEDVKEDEQDKEHDDTSKTNELEKNLEILDVRDEDNNIKVVEVDEDLDLANYLKLTVKELKVIVKEKNLHSDPSRLRKNQLIDLLQKQ